MIILLQRTSILLITILLLLAASCNAPTIGIFYALEREEKVKDKDKGIPKTAFINKTIKFNGSWFAVGNKIYKTGVKGSATTELDNWTRMTNPGGLEIAVDAVLVGSTMYAVFSGSTDPGQVYSTTDGSNWTSLAGAEDAGEHAIRVFKYGTDLLVETRKGTENVYRLKRMTGTTGALTFGGSTSLSSPIQAVASKGGTSNFIFTNDGIWNHTALTVTDATRPLTEYFSGITFLSATDTGSNIYAVSTGGQVIRWSGTAWTSTTATSNSTNATFTSIIDISNSGAAAGYKIIAASDNLGLWYIDETTSTPVAKIMSEGDGNYFATSFYRKSVWALGGGETATDPIFAGTPSLGLWSSYWSGATDKHNQGLIWTHE